MFKKILLFNKIKNIFLSNNFSSFNKNNKLLNKSKYLFNKRNLFNNEQFLKNIFCIENEIENALNEGKPIVALESALITSGLEYPLNIKYLIL
jgi:hypothetical protein